MVRSNSTVTMLAVLSALVLTLAACVDHGHIYSHYRSVGGEGWQREDTVGIVLGPVRQGGQYAEEFGLRTNSHYPFMQLAMIVEQEARPSGFRRTDTLCARLTDDEGYVKGEGISHYQYRFPLSSVLLADGDTLSLRIRHNMMRSPLAGVTDVGFTIIQE